MFIGNSEKFYRGIQLPISLSFKRQKQAEQFLENVTQIIPALKFERIKKTKEYVFYLGDSENEENMSLKEFLATDKKREAVSK